MNIGDAIAFGTAIEYLERLGMDAVCRHDAERRSRRWKGSGRSPA